MSTPTTRSLVQTAFGAALIAVLANLSLPTHPVPFTLLTLAIGLVATLLPPRQAVMAGVIYLILGVIGLPVFANGGAGFQILAGPTAGYLWGIPLYLGATSLLTKKEPGLVTIFLANLLGNSLLFLTGWLGLQVLADMTPQVAFTAGVLPFILFDLIKLLIITAISKPILRAIAPLLGKN